MPHQFVQKLQPARGTAINTEQLPQFPNVSSFTATGNSRLYGLLLSRQGNPSQRSCIQSATSNYYGLAPSPASSLVFQLADYQKVFTLLCSFLSLHFPFSLFCFPPRLFYLPLFLPLSVSLNISLAHIFLHSFFLPFIILFHFFFTVTSP